MLNLSYSFKPNGEYFIFSLDTGKTIETPILKNARKARMAWTVLRGR